MALVFLVLNGKSCASLAVREAVIRLRAEGYTLQVRVTWEAGDFQRYLLEAVQAGCETLIAGGGDGTLNEAVTSLLSLPPGQRPVLGILPLGTANDFATSAQIPLQPEAALRLALEANAVPMDVAVVNQNHHFINMATGGFGTRITIGTPEKLKAALGGVSYLLHGLMQLDTLKADQCEIRSEDFYWRGEALVIGIGNGRQAGGGQRLCPTALIDDGRLDLTIVTSQQLFPTLLHSMTRSEEMPHLITHRSQGFTLTAEHEMTFNLDGEPVKGRQFSFRLEAEAIRCRLPPQCPLLS